MLSRRVLPIRVGVHVGVAAVILRLGWIAHAAGVAPARLVPQVVGPAQLAGPFFYHAVVWITQEQVRSDVAVVVAVPDVLEGGGVVVDPAACPAGNARQPQRRAIVAKVPIGATARAEELTEQRQVTRQGCALVRRAYRLDQAAAGGGVQAAPVIGVQVQ